MSRSKLKCASNSLFLKNGVISSIARISFHSVGSDCSKYSLIAAWSNHSSLLRRILSSLRQWEGLYSGLLGPLKNAAKMRDRHQSFSHHAYTSYFPEPINIINLNDY